MDVFLQIDKNQQQQQGPPEIATIMEMEGTAKYKVADLDVEVKVASGGEGDNGKGLTWGMAILFIVGEVLGGGVLAVGDAMVNMGWASIGVMLFCLLVNCYALTIMSEVIVIITDPAKKSRDPYSKAVEKCFGVEIRLLVGVNFYMLNVFVQTAYIIISTQLLLLFVHEFFPDFHTLHEFRVWLCIVTLVLIPITWFGTPADFWGLALFAVLTTVIAAVCISIVLWTVSDLAHLNLIPQRPVTVITFFFGTGTVFFSFCGVPFLPIIQTDMKKIGDFKRSAYFSYVIIGLVYLPMGLFGMVLLGNGTMGNVLMNAEYIMDVETDPQLKTTFRGLVYTATIMLTGHFVFAYTIIFNSLAQDIEENLKIPRAFNWKRVACRTGLVLFSLVLAQVIPKFEVFMSIAGGVLGVPLSFYLPMLMYVKLVPEVGMSKKAFMSLLCFLCTVCAVGAVYANIMIIKRIYS